MVGTIPLLQQAPLDYKYALDAAMATLANKSAPFVVCAVPQLAAEIRQRLPNWASGPASAALWVEPQHGTWRAEIAQFAKNLAPGAPLVIIAARPLARLLPERKAWADRPLGLEFYGLGGLKRCLQADFLLEAEYGIHSISAIGLSLIGQQMEGRGHPAIGDRLHFASRLAYQQSGWLANWATVALLFAVRQASKRESGYATS
jgi:hypothetical protein